MNWWVTQGDRQPVGPVSTELLLAGIEARKVPRDALICEVGGSQWKWIGDIAPFTEALAKLKDARRFDPDSERIVLDLAPLPASESEPPLKGDRGVPLRRFDESAERTVAELPPFPPSEPPPPEPLQRFDSAEEKTIVDAEPLRPSDPPT
jgi:hypothetical protein